MSHRLRGVYLITNTAIQDRFSHAQLAKQAVEAGVSLVQYRDKKASGKEAVADIKEMLTHTGPADTVCIVNDRADLALAGGADGVHLGQEDLPVSPARDIMGADLIIGRTSSTPEEALRAQQEGADYVALGHIFETGTKQKDYPPRGLDMLSKVCEAVTIPVVAIGGITLDNAPKVIEAGADCIAICSAICKADEPARAARKFVDLFE